MNNDEFINQMMEFKGVVQTSLGELCKDIKELKTERKEHSDKFWQKMDVITQSIHDEKNERNTVINEIARRDKEIRSKYYR